MASQKHKSKIVALFQIGLVLLYFPSYKFAGVHIAMIFSGAFFVGDIFLWPRVLKRHGNESSFFI
jgi:hypothetical protein